MPEPREPDDTDTTEPLVARVCDPGQLAQFRPAGPPIGTEIGRIPLSDPTTVTSAPISIDVGCDDDGVYNHRVCTGTVQLFLPTGQCLPDEGVFFYGSTSACGPLVCAPFT